MYGQLAALLTALAWTGSAVAFEAAGRRIGSLNVNVWRLVVAAALFVIVGLVVRGEAWPSELSETNFWWLAASALVGLVLGDLCLFRAYVLIGPRLGLLIMATTPIWAALIDRLLFEQALTMSAVAGMVLVLAGVILALRSRHTSDDLHDPRRGSAPPRPQPPQPSRARLRLGAALALGGAIGQAAGLILSKLGLEGTGAIEATQVRITVALILFIPIRALSSSRPRSLELRGEGRAMAYTTIGAVLGPFLGVTASLVAVAHIPAGVAASIMATTPIWMVGVDRLRRRPVPAAGLWGAMLACIGTSLLFI